MFNPFGSNSKSRSGIAGMQDWPETPDRIIDGETYHLGRDERRCNQCGRNITRWMRPNRSVVAWICDTCQIAAALEVISAQGGTINRQSDLVNSQSAALAVARKDRDELKAQLKIANGGWTTAQAEREQLQERVAETNRNNSSLARDLNDWKQRALSAETKVRHFEATTTLDADKLEAIRRVLASPAVTFTDNTLAEAPKPEAEVKLAGKNLADVNPALRRR